MADSPEQRVDEVLDMLQQLLLEDRMNDTPGKGLALTTPIRAHTGAGHNHQDAGGMSGEMAAVDDDIGDIQVVDHPLALANMYAETGIDPYADSGKYAHHHNGKAIGSGPSAAAAGGGGGGGANQVQVAHGDFCVWSDGDKLTVEGINSGYVGLVPSVLSHNNMSGVLVPGDLNTSLNKSEHLQSTSEIVDGAVVGNSGKAPGPEKGTTATVGASVGAARDRAELEGNGGAAAGSRGYFAVHVFESVVRPDVPLKQLLAAAVKVARDQGYRYTLAHTAHLLVLPPSTHRKHTTTTTTTSAQSLTVPKGIGAEDAELLRLAKDPSALGSADSVAGGASEDLQACALGLEAGASSPSPLPSSMRDNVLAATATSTMNSIHSMSQQMSHSKKKRSALSETFSLVNRTLSSEVKNLDVKEWDVIDIQVCISRELRQRVVLCQFLRRVPSIDGSGLGGAIIHQLTGGHTLLPLRQCPLSKAFVGKLKVTSFIYLFIHSFVH